MIAKISFGYLQLREIDLETVKRSLEHVEVNLN